MNSLHRRYALNVIKTINALHYYYIRFFTNFTFILQFYFYFSFCFLFVFLKYIYILHYFVFYLSSICAIPKENSAVMFYPKQRAGLCWSVTHWNVNYGFCLWQGLSLSLFAHRYHRSAAMNNMPLSFSYFY